MRVPTVGVVGIVREDVEDAATVEEEASPVDHKDLAGVQRATRKAGTEMENEIVF